ncbi:MAG: MarR family transcriptional regulator [Chloroflexi bacterium]|nr:MarR family transcriptional regulator [Chloroflexota bacterium]MCL5111143.1 MarR family transcriptional regulator [Chloroflexota bacterium]
MAESAEESAREVLEVVPLVMRAIRAEMRRRGGHDLSVPQFRALNYVGRHEGCSLSTVAEHLGLSRPSTSTLIEGLLERGLVLREEHPTDRRRVTLALTLAGRASLEAARRATAARLGDALATLSPEERETVARAMAALRPIFTPGDQGQGGTRS